MVATLHSPKVYINLVGWIDSTKKGGILSTFESVPDAPVSNSSSRWQGGKKGLMVNSEDLCGAKHQAKAGSSSAVRRPPPAPPEKLVTPSR